LICNYSVESVERIKAHMMKVHHYEKMLAGYLFQEVAIELPEAT
jgi:hypothetical protein